MSPSQRTLLGFVRNQVGSSLLLKERKMPIGQVVHETIASEVSTGTSGADGTRVSKDSDPTVFNCPDGFMINRDSVVSHVESERGSEHTFNTSFSNFVTLIPGTPIQAPTTLTLTTHARSSTGPFGGGGGMKVSVEFDTVQFR
jgi:hypothetical protein